jgi:hypothetical protein
MAPTYLPDYLPTTIGETVTYNFRNNDDYRTQRCRLQTRGRPVTILAASSCKHPTVHNHTLI